jgi:hypothetical protein
MNKFTESSTWKGTVRGTKKVLKWTASIVVIILAIFIYWRYFYTYSEGYRTGLLQKFSSKGTLFKTYEGEIILSSISSTQDVAIASEKFYFTLKNKDLVRQFDMMQGQNVIVHYKQKNAPLFFRGDSEYLVDSVRVRN